MKKIIVASLLLLSSVAFASSGAKYLFLATAPHALLKHDKGAQYSLIMQEHPGKVGYFTDRPQRESGLLDFNQFMKLWTSKKVANNFSKVPPNVAVAMVLNNGVKQSFIAEMAKPEIKNNQVIYHLTKTSTKAIKTGKTSNVILFIDDIKWNPGGF